MSDPKFDETSDAVTTGFVATTGDSAQASPEMAAAAITAPAECRIKVRVLVERFMVFVNYYQNLWGMVLAVHGKIHKAYLMKPYTITSGFLLLMSSGMLAADEVDMEIQVMAWPEFAAAKAVPMVAAPLPVETPNPILEMPDVRAKKDAEERINEIFRKLSLPVPEAYDWMKENRSYHFISARVESAALHVGISLRPETLQADYVSFTMKAPLEKSLRQVTPKSFLDYATECHRLFFGSDPVGEPKFGMHDGFGMRDQQGESVTWNAVVNGVHLGAGSITFGLQADGQHTLKATCSVSPRDVDDATEFFAKYPVRCSERAAMATVFKTWKQLSKVPDSHRDQKCFIQCHRVKLEQTYGMHSMNRESKASWTHPEVKSDLLPPYLYDVTIHWGLFQVNACVDWNSGQVLKMSQGIMAW